MQQRVHSVAQLYRRPVRGKTPRRGPSLPQMYSSPAANVRNGSEAATHLMSGMGGKRTLADRSCSGCQSSLGYLNRHDQTTFLPVVSQFPAELARYGSCDET